jgi:predicted transposase/invertase (TIGR01784 family)
VIKIKTEDKAFIMLTDDLLFKETFGMKQNRKYLEDLLESYYGFPKHYLKGKLDVSYETTLDKLNYQNKAMRGDLIVKFDDIIVNIEMYSTFNKETYNKSKSYIMRIYSTQLDRGDSYSSIEKVTQINFIDNVKFGISEDVKRTILIGDEITSDDFSMDIVRLDIARKIEYNQDDRFLLWVKFLGAKTREDRKEIAKGDGLLMALDTWLEQYTSDKDLDNFFRTYNDEYWNKRIYREDGRLEGLEQKANEIAKSMLKDNVSIETIAKYTDMSLEDIQKLQNSSAEE